MRYGESIIIKNGGLAKEQPEIRIANNRGLQVFKNTEYLSSRLKLNSHTGLCRVVFLRDRYAEIPSTR